MVHHGSETFHIEGEGVVATQLGGRSGHDPDPLNAPDGPPTAPATRQLAAGEAPEFRFSRVGPKGRRLRLALARKLATAMVDEGGGTGREGIPAGYTYLGQFVDHDLTLDRSALVPGGEQDPLTILSGRSPRLDLDCLYGLGPQHPDSEKFFAADGVKLKVGTTSPFGSLPSHAERDLPRVGVGTDAEARRALIPDHRNDENLAVAQTHVAFINFHNKVVDKVPDSVAASRRFSRARRAVTLHYQWLLRHDYLPRIVVPRILDDVWEDGRKVFEAGASPIDVPTMPVEFSAAAFRMGHSMIRGAYNWNAEFPVDAGTLGFLFTFSGTSGDMFGATTLPSNWIVDWRRLYDFPAAGKPGLAAPGGTNLAMRLDTRLTDPLRELPLLGLDADETLPVMQRNLAFRNLVRGSLLRLASGQQMVKLFRDAGLTTKALTRAQIIDGSGGARLTGLTSAEKDAIATRTPLWFYVLREAEVTDGLMRGVGGRLVAETFHRAIEGSRNSIVRNADWTPTFGPRRGTFEMTDLLQFTYGSTKKALAPVG